MTGRVLKTCLIVALIAAFARSPRRGFPAQGKGMIVPMRLVAAQAEYAIGAAVDRHRAGKIGSPACDPAQAGCGGKSSTRSRFPVGRIGRAPSLTLRNGIGRTAFAVIRWMTVMPAIAVGIDI